MNLYQQITSEENITAAYHALVVSFEEAGKAAKYKSYDGLSLTEMAPVAGDMVAEIREELMHKTPLEPVQQYEIPKPNGGVRTVYTYTLKERLKAQAVAQVVQEKFEAALTPFLYSYRSTHPCHLAAKSIVRRYHRYYGQDYVFRGDVTAYFECIDLDILRQQLDAMNFDPDTRAILELYIRPQTFLNGRLGHREKGIVHGTPVAILFANGYLSGLDEKVGKRVALYRRVGDDVIICDKSEQRIREAKEIIMAELRALKLEMQDKKTTIGPNTEPFSFLGYEFDNRVVSIRKKALARMYGRWRRKLKYYPISIDDKRKRLRSLLWKDSDSIHHDMLSILSAYRYANDAAQADEISRAFGRVLTKYFFKDYTPRAHRRMKSIIKGLKLPSYARYFYHLKHGKATLKSLLVQKQKYA